MSEMLKPCPFCGNVATTDECLYDECDEMWWVAGCDKCSIGFTGSTKEEAVAAWNRRAEAKEESREQ
jgi:Lar family restriction alleviation protein